MLYLPPHFSVALSASNESNISVVIKVPLLSHDPSLKLFSKKTLEILGFLLTISRVSLKRTHNICLKKLRIRHPTFSTFNPS